MSRSRMTKVDRLRLELRIAIKLYARARRIPIEDAKDNVRDAADIELESKGASGDAHLDSLDDQPMWNCGCGVRNDGALHCPACGSCAPWGCGMDHEEDEDGDEHEHEESYDVGEYPV
jgi:hypothetical protein